ncbi:nitrogenase molybdenum-iron protein beta subunit NifK [Gottschalkia acidurici 9a]|uniref:Nitrogenase molybdenum-iron protein beta subunit NifK n=1 Tax=Gottschalkia acidurici (strain ATCC 7906 / DSM 604 / BCRC 14475 / CIP 104303 / KCTC 5404 / NCIMB 10678 / 9a) TaxID=1128398 RepID=K0B219_GOTA9|nr:nitrogenase component 1 [Gottschalkia acidurici]AFS79162.1 nitrogenase molybdenum-iron protein beta subunit NifK [Gottschalkia acidurici 9a]
MSKFIEQPRYSCALGAQQTVVAIKRAVPIVHAGPGCSGKISALIGQGEGYAGGNTIPCTNTSESEVVFGGEGKLRNVIDGAFKVIDGDLYVVLTGCTSDIVGDDIGSVTSDYQKQDRPIVYVETGGFKSNNYVSHSVVVNAIIDQYVDKYKVNEEVEKGLVNVFASIPYQDQYWNGNLEEIKRILEGIGLKVNILFGLESEGINEWKTIPNAEFNIVVSTWAGLEIAEHLKEKYNTPYFHFSYLPIGGKTTSEFLRQVAEFGNIDKEKVEGFIKKEEEKFYAHIERTADFMLEFRYGLPRRFYTILDANYAIGFSKFLLNELGIIPAKQYIIDDTPEKYRESIRELFNKISEHRSADVQFSVDGGIIQEEISKDKQKNRALILGSGWERDLAQNIKGDLLIISAPVAYRLILNCGYAGYNGGLRVIEDIYDIALNTYR